MKNILEKNCTKMSECSYSLLLEECIFHFWLINEEKVHIKIEDEFGDDIFLKIISDKEKLQKLIEALLD